MTHLLKFNALTLGLGLLVNLLLFVILASMLAQQRRLPPQLSCQFTIRQFIPDPDLLAQTISLPADQPLGSAQLPVTIP